MPVTDRKSGFPIGNEVRLATLAADPYPTFERLRNEEPISWIAETGAWFVTQRADVVDVLRDTETFTTDHPASLIQDTFGPQMLSSDAAQQRRFRKPTLSIFHPRWAHEQMASHIEREAQQLIDGFADSGTVELGSQFASPLSLDSVAVVLGLPCENYEEIRDWYDEFAAALANFSGDTEIRRRGHDAAEQFRRFVRPHLARLTEQPDQFLLSTLAAAKDPLTTEEILSNAMLVLFGGLETTESMILNTLWALLTHEEQLDAVRRDPQLVPAAVEESLRFDAAVQSCTRHVRVATQFRGVEMASGEAVQCMLGAANRDPAWFDEPDRFDIRRPNATEHLTFGYGKHLCVGAPLARLETEIAVRSLFERLDGLTLDREQSTPPFGYEFRKPRRMIVRWGAG